MKPADIFLATLVAALWGGNYVAAKFGMTHLPPFFLSVLRFALVAVLVLPFVPIPSRTEMRHIFGLALVLGTLHFSFAISSMYYGLDIATSIIMLQLSAPFSCALGVVFFGEKLGVWRTLGMVVAFMGVVLVVGTPQVSEHYTGFLMVLFAALSFSVATLMMKRMPRIAIMPLTGWMAALSVPTTMLLSVVIEEGHWELLETLTMPAVGSFVYSALGSSILAYALWYRLLQRYEMSQVVPFTLLAPFFGIAFGQMFFAEPLGMKTLIGGAITLIGVAIITFRRPRTAPIGKGA